MMNFTKDTANKQLHIVRTFNAPQEKIWKAWTVAAILDQWWGPKPYNTQTKTMDFRVGGMWLYTMVGPDGPVVAPDGTKLYSKVEYTAIDSPNSFESINYFCDENGGRVAAFPSTSRWAVNMKEDNGVTTVNVTLTFDDLAGLEKLVAMGFEGGFTMGLQQLEELLESL